MRFFSAPFDPGRAESTHPTPTLPLHARFLPLQQRSAFLRSASTAECGTVECEPATCDRFVKDRETFNSGYFTLEERGLRCELELSSQEGRLEFIVGRAED